jgi:hypothetical protein
LLNIDAGSELDIEFDSGTGNYSQIDFKIDSFVNAGFYACQYSGSELTVYLYSEINSDANKELLISIIFEVDLYVSVCNIFPLQLLGRQCKLHRFAHQIKNIPAIPFPSYF